MISVLSFTSSGERVAEKIAESFEIVHYKNADVRIKDKMEEIWKSSKAIVFISASGIGVRYIAPFLVHKSVDPAVIVIDDMGRYVISLLSGHLGGANDMANAIANAICAEPIITTASDSRDFESPDLFAKRNGYKIANPEKLTALSAAMVEGRCIMVYSEVPYDLDYTNICEIENLEDIKSDDIVIAITSSVISMSNLYIQMIPQNLNLGIGCRRGVAAKDIIELIDETFKEQKLHIEGIAGIYSIDLKVDEIGLLEAAEHYGIEPVFYSADELKTVEHNFKSSDFVKKVTGVGAVAEPAACLSGGELVVERVAKNDITLAIAKIRNEK